MKAAPEAHIGMNRQTPDRQQWHRARTTGSVVGAQAPHGEGSVDFTNVSLHFKVLCDILIRTNVLLRFLSVLAKFFTPTYNAPGWWS
jgi:hypothetical protein